jgi:hypothetical protein
VARRILWKRREGLPKEALNGGSPERVPEAQGDAEADSLPRIWDRPDDRFDPPSARPEDTYEEERRRRKAG